MVSGDDTGAGDDEGTLVTAPTVGPGDTRVTATVCTGVFVAVAVGTGVWVATAVGVDIGVAVGMTGVLEGMGVDRSGVTDAAKLAVAVSSAGGADVGELTVATIGDAMGNMAVPRGQNNATSDTPTTIRARPANCLVCKCVIYPDFPLPDRASTNTTPPTIKTRPRPHISQLPPIGAPTVATVTTGARVGDAKETETGVSEATGGALVCVGGIAVWVAVAEANAVTVAEANTVAVTEAGKAVTVAGTAVAVDAFVGKTCATVALGNGVIPTGTVGPIGIGVSFSSGGGGGGGGEGGEGTDVLQGTVPPHWRIGLWSGVAHAVLLDASTRS